MPTAVWKEFPEINRKVAFQCNYSTPSSPLGCHCGSINGVTANFGTGYYAAFGGKNIEVLDETKEPAIKYVTEKYSASWVAPAEELALVLKHLKDIDLKYSDLPVISYADIADQCAKLPLWVLSDVVNSKSPARVPATFTGETYLIIGRTADFAQWLIDNKHGYVMASPIVQNPQHRSYRNYSLNQGWFWIPPSHLARAIDVAKDYGSEDLPEPHKWAVEVRKDVSNYLGADDLSALKKDENLFQKFFNEGVFPERKIFRNRNVKGQFVGKEA